MISISGSNGFIGKNLIHYLNINSNFEIDKLNLRNEWFLKKRTTSIIHLAGIAHDLKNKINNSIYYNVNFDLTKKLFDDFVKSDAKTFIFISTIKAVSDFSTTDLNEEVFPKPITDYGKSKLLAENYILGLSKNLNNKKVYILRPTMVYGPGNKGNLNLLYTFVKKGIPWPLASFQNKRSLCYVGNLCYVINFLLTNDIPSGIYNVCDDDAISTNDIIRLIGISNQKKPLFLLIPKWIVITICKIGSFLSLPINKNQLNKLTRDFVVNNSKIKHYIGCNMPFSTGVELLKTFKSFTNLN